MIKLIKRIVAGVIFRMGLPFRWLMIYHYRFYRFILPNLKKIAKNEIVFANIPHCNQKLKVAGQGKVEFGENTIFGYKLGGQFYNGMIEIQPRYKGSLIKIGNNVSTNNNLILCAANYIEIGDHTLIGEGVSIMDHEGHGIAPEKRGEIGEIGKVIIGRNVWIGNKVMILKNSIIGENSIVAAGAVVAGNFPANVIIGGVPAKVIRTL